jgi:hypothetical protein
VVGGGGRRAGWAVEEDGALGWAALGHKQMGLLRCQQIQVKNSTTLCTELCTHLFIRFSVSQRICSLGWLWALTHAGSFFGKNLVAVRGTLGNGKRVTCATQLGMKQTHRSWEWMGSVGNEANTQELWMRSVGNEANTQELGMGSRDTVGNENGVGNGNGRTMNGAAYPLRS